MVLPVNGSWRTQALGPLYELRIISTGYQACAAGQCFMQQPSDIRKIAFLGDYLPSCLRAADFLNRTDTSKDSD
jgi:hypothetical protein